jgi:hypothetical protein
MATPRTFVPTAVAALAVTAAAATSAHADIGVAVSYGRIDVHRQLKPGRKLELPAMRVRNVGDEVTTYGMTFSPIAGRPRHVAKASWFAFSPRSFTLRPGQSRLVRIIVRPWRHAWSGSYEGLLKAQVVDRNATGPSVGLAAAARITFRVSGRR